LNKFDLTKFRNGQREYISKFPGSEDKMQMHSIGSSITTPTRTDSNIVTMSVAVRKSSHLSTE